MEDGVCFKGPYEAVRVGQRQRLEQHRIHHREQRDRRPDAERHDDDGDEGKARGASQCSDSITKVA
jgi:hypothetical protein